MWEKGVPILSHDMLSTYVTTKVALMCVGCDIPASRKMSGFLGHTAKYGCSKCLKPFSGTVGSMDYSGFKVSDWPKRNL